MIKHKAYIYVLGVLVFCCVLRVFISRTFNLQDIRSPQAHRPQGLPEEEKQKTFRNVAFDPDPSVMHY